MKGNRITNNNIADVVAPMFAITMELDAIIGTLLHEKFKIPLADFKILRVVYILDICTQRDIARFNQVTEAAVSKRITSLSKEGLIKKEVSIEDRRRSALSLTIKGKTLMKQMQAVVVHNTELMLVNFSKANRKLTTTLLTEILQSLVEHSPNKDMLLQSKHPILEKLNKCKSNYK